MNRYETFEHIADIGIRGYGLTIEDALRNCAKALFSIMYENFNEFSVDSTFKFEINSPTLEGILVKFLNRLITLSQLERVVFSEFELNLKGQTLEVKAYGTKLEVNKFIPGTEVKGATFCEAKVEKIDSYFLAQCVVDV